MAASVAAQLSKENDLEVETAKGGLGEFSVSIDGRKVVDTNRLWAAFKGQNANGVWTVTVIDRFAGDTGNVRAFSLVITSY